MRPSIDSKRLLAALACSIACTAQAGVIWDESANGDFSNDGLAPTALVLTSGSSSVLGTTGNSGQGIDRDYFSITIPAGAVLTSLTVLGNTNVSGGSSFIGLQSGAQLTVSPTGMGAENLVGYMHYGNDFIGVDLLPLLAPAFHGGLPSGTYSLWVQETGGPATYGFAFNVAAVPVPGAALLLGSGLLGLIGVGRRNRNSRR